MSGRNDSPYGPEDRIFPSVSDDDLWRGVYARLREAYPERLLLEHARWAFETVCEENDDGMPFKDFVRKVKLTWLWKRPPAPRGVPGLPDPSDPENL